VPGGTRELVTDQFEVVPLGAAVTVAVASRVPVGPPSRIWTWPTGAVVPLCALTEPEKVTGKPWVTVVGLMVSCEVLVAVPRLVPVQASFGGTTDGLSAAAVAGQLPTAWTMRSTAPTLQETVEPRFGLAAVRKPLASLFPVRPRAMAVEPLTSAEGTWVSF